MIQASGVGQLKRAGKGPPDRIKNPFYRTIVVIPTISSNLIIALYFRGLWGEKPGTLLNKEDEETCVSSGHKYKVNRKPLKSFYVSGIGANCNDSFVSTDKAEEHIDFLIKVNTQR